MLEGKIYVQILDFIPNYVIIHLFAPINTLKT